ncbi:TOMM precursor leader peptide-binding protein [Amycolatopsis suaedae]|nr:TOMM precursor leader peptide-binding protein [Amycolatopsis suaedae]
MSAHTVSIPRRPCLVPGIEVFERGADEVQVGLDPRHGVLARGVPRQLVPLLRELDGTRTATSLFALAGSERVEQLRTVLTRLTALGLVEDASSAGRHAPRGETGTWPLRVRCSSEDLHELRAHCAVRIYGGSRLAIAVVSHLAAAGVGYLDLRTTGLVTPCDIGSGYTRADVGIPRRRAAAELIHRVNPHSKLAHPPERQSPDLVVLADSVVPAPEIVHELTQDGLPHLPVRVREGIGIVGPLVMPGRSSCLRCADLHRSDRDRSWPRVASQLAGREQRTDLTTAQATASLAASQVLRALTPGDEEPPAWNATLEIDNFDATVFRRAWAPHPACGCGAPPGW